MRKKARNNEKAAEGKRASHAHEGGGGCRSF
jgi:hypothetical protein